MQTVNAAFSKHILQIALLLIVIALAGACAPRARQPLFTVTDQSSTDTAFLQALDEAVFKAGVNNAAVFRLDGFPYFRVNRFLCALKNRITADAEKELWIDWMLAEDMMTRYVEISCLPREIREQLAGQAGVEPSALALATHAGNCATALLAAHRRQPGFYESVAAAVDCPEEYKTALRVVGLYPLVSLPIALLTKKAHRRMTGWLNQTPDTETAKGATVNYVPKKRSLLSVEAVGRILRESSANALSIPIPDGTAQRILAEYFAPVITQETTGDADRPGMIKWQDGDIQVDGNRPTVYYYLTNAFYRHTPILQINYVVWYPARKGPGAPALERGKLDGLTIRVSLGGDGRTVMVDIMNNCGCYHFFVPADGTIKAIKPQPWTIDAFAPIRLPALFPQNRLNIHVNADWHQVLNITADPPETDDFAYRLTTYETLEMLPATDGSHESLFNGHGIAKGSKRIEPLVLFSMGIPKVGSMRQRSHHALKLVGRSYFSDPYLFDRSFEFIE